MSNLITEPGLYRVKTADYHADRLMDGPTLSSGVAKTLVDGTPYEAWWKHPRLNPNYDKSGDDEIKRKTAFGSAGHEMVLGLHDGEESLIEFIPFADYRTEEARTLRDNAIAAGKFPMKRDELAEAEEVVEAVKKQIDITTQYPGDAEICAIAKVDGVMCRCLCDWLVRDGRTIIDLKFTKKSMSKRGAFSRHCVDMSYDVAQGHYRSVIAAIEGCDVYDVRYVFLVIERGPPVLASIRELPIGHREAGLEKAQYARQIWAESLKSGKWPAHGNEVIEDEPADWDIKRWEGVKQDRRLDLSVTGLMPFQAQEACNESV